jgi:thymidylate synthase
MMDFNYNVNSNYGYQWNRNNQIGKVVEMLKNDPTTRKASISLYDGKEIDLYSKDTVCTYAINFYITDRKLNMQVMMRSNDLVYGFCNDQYCFSKLQIMVANWLNLKIGIYTHFVCNMHIYQRHFNLKNK